ncbi:HD domain-containing protein [Paeniglutamicibacter psychrophenolicus]|uniref:HD-GYP domain-containing protein (C-di-GMP phosphodiesterase class II) n=1 Tax=Paeniglutamicibacter psychrophenolicus TaxID=257454 RepID=A0ABS4WJG5_9MICC|nr:HD domain-containing phosphohydrolase [Paeniglutamicibacter psychrophenolicus]MBP2376333.1 HD-GYP domain-containing protein (c-di-GMP phosphodiesterase class II) [Paeniglutamicibacter psychrophenolicus]
MEGEAAHRAAGSGIRLAELVGTLSLAMDLGLGQPMEHVARSALLATKLGERTGLGPADRADLYYVALLGWVGCIADSPESSRRFGDDIAYRAGVFDVDMAPLPFLGYLLRTAGTGAPAARRLGTRAALLATGAAGVKSSLRTHCLVAAEFAGRLGLGPGVSGPLQQVFARWDGHGLPAGLGGSRIAVATRLWQLCDVLEVHHRRGGTAAALAVAEARSGTQFDPELVAAFRRDAEELFAELPAGSAFEALIDAEPGLHREVTGAELDPVLGVLADYADLKAPRLRGHSRAVARLAAAAARRLGLEDEQVRLLGRAALLHDLGRTGIPNAILEKDGELDRTEAERLRMLPYYTERMLARPAALREIGQLAALAHERLDGSGHHRGLNAAMIPLPGRILAAANEYQRLREPRPVPHTAERAAGLLVAQVAAGGMDAGAVDAVLACAGQAPERRPTGPAGLTAREVQVLVLLARGASNRQIAARLGIASKTAGNHIERIYAKAGVGSRAAATLFAMRHGLLDRLQEFGDGVNAP